MHKGVIFHISELQNYKCAPKLENFYISDVKSRKCAEKYDYFQFLIKKIIKI